MDMSEYKFELDTDWIEHIKKEFTKMHSHLIGKLEKDNEIGKLFASYLITNLLHYQEISHGALKEGIRIGVQMHRLANQTDDLTLQKEAQSWFKPSWPALYEDHSDEEDCETCGTDHGKSGNHAEALIGILKSLSKEIKG